MRPAQDLQGLPVLRCHQSLQSLGVVVSVGSVLPKGSFSQHLQGAKHADEDVHMLCRPSSQLGSGTSFDY